MTTKTITRQVIVCDWCEKDSLYPETTFENNSCDEEDKDVHICDDCRQKHDDFEVWHKSDILSDSTVDEEDRAFARTWGIVKNTDYSFVKWIK